MDIEPFQIIHLHWPSCGWDNSVSWDPSGSVDQIIGFIHLKDDISFYAPYHFKAYQPHNNFIILENKFCIYFAKSSLLMILIYAFKIYYKILIPDKCLSVFGVFIGLSPLSRYHIYVLKHIIYIIFYCCANLEYFKVQSSCAQINLSPRYTKITIRGSLSYKRTFIYKGYMC